MKTPIIIVIVISLVLILFLILNLLYFFLIGYNPDYCMNRFCDYILFFYKDDKNQEKERVNDLIKFKKICNKENTLETILIDK